MTRSWHEWMRRIALIVLVVACGSKESRPRKEPDKTSSEVRPSPGDASLQEVSVTGADPMTFCDSAKRVLRRAIECMPSRVDETESALSNLESLISELTADAPQSARERTAALCALNVIAFDLEMRARTDLKCPAALSVDERARNRAYLVAYYGHRMKPRPSGDSKLDQQLSALAAARDVMCSCADLACVQQAQKTVDTAVTPIPREMKTAMEDAASLVDDVSRCADRIEAGLHELPL
ncbi:MAG: hypothetical protein HOV81_03670 [Kofleriaceae bacterium]|nr:hypothetical protein [Kofleriaceae bacterium]